MTFQDRLQTCLAENKMQAVTAKQLSQLCGSYAKAVKHLGIPADKLEALFITLLNRVLDVQENPFNFEPYHTKVTQPFDYSSFGIDFVRPLIDETTSKTLYPDNIKRIEKQLLKGENAVLFGNHQTELDPQLIRIALEKTHPELASEMIFVAGDRVLTDPLAVPFSMGCNLLCIYSKRHINHPPEKKQEKQHHNQRTMRKMKDLFAEGGKFIYVAPSGGRDRPNDTGEVVVAPFDPQSIEMFRLMAKKSGVETHFYPLAINTFNILPPPSTIKSTLGEERTAQRSGIQLAFGDEIDMNTFPGNDLKDKHARRVALAMHIWNLVKTDYALLKENQ